MSDTIKKNNSKKQEQQTSLLQLMFEQFLQHKMAVIGSIIIVFFILIALLAPTISLLTGISPNHQNVFNRYKPPMTQSETTEKEVRIEKYINLNREKINKIASAIKEENILKDIEDAEDSEIIFSFMESLQEESFLEIVQKKALYKELIKLHNSFKITHILGTDELGRDVLIRLIFGTRVSIGVALFVAFFSALIGLLIGVFSALLGGWVDSLLMRFTDALLSIPQLPLLIVFAAVDLNKVPLFNLIAGTEKESIIKIIFILCIFSWMTVARLVRSTVLSLKKRDFILASKNMGASLYEIITKHIVPNTLAPVIVTVTINVGHFILYESALSFLGLGIQPPATSWGNMLFNAQEIIYEYPLLAFFPGFLILIIVMCFNFMGDGLQNAINPKGFQR